MSLSNGSLVFFTLVLLSPSRLVAQADSPATYSPLQQSARALKAADRLTEAGAAYRKALEVLPNWSDGWWEFATVEYDLGNYSTSQDALRHFLKVNPKSGSGWALKGLAEYELGMPAQALADLHRSDALAVTEENNLQGIAKLHEIILYNTTGNFEEAFKILTGLCGQSPASPSLAIPAGVTALRIDSLPSAIPVNKRDLVYRVGLAVCDAIAGRTSQADAGFVDVLQRYPDTPQVHYLYGCFLIKDHPDEGLMQLLAELSIAPAHEPAMTEVALEYLRRGADEKALPYAEKAVTVSPRSEKAQFALGRVMLDLNHVESGIKHLQQAVALAPSDRTALWALSSAYSAQGNDQAAERIRLKLNQ